MSMVTPSSSLASRTLLHGSRLAQASWLLFALFSLSLALAGILPYTRLLQTTCHGARCLAEQLTPSEAEALSAAGQSLADYAQTELIVGLVTNLLVLVTAGTLIWRKPANRSAVLGAFVFVALGTSTLARAAGQSMPMLELPARLLQVVHVAGLQPFFSLLPDGRFRTTWLRGIALAAVVAAVLMIFGRPAPLFYMLFCLLSAGLIAGSLIAHYRRTSTTPEQEQIVWALAAFALLAAAQGIGRPLRPLPLPALPLDRLPLPFISFFSVFGMLLAVGSLTCLAVALLNDELFRVEVALNRALVYSLLTLFVVGSYVLVVGYLALLFQSSGSVWFSLIATGVVAVLFQPVQARVQRFVNGLLYGLRDDPYQVIVGLGRRLEAAYEPSTLLPAIVQTVRESLGLPHVAIALYQADSAPIVVSDGSPPTRLLSFPLAYGGEMLGELRVSPRRGEATLAPADRHLLDDLAQQAGVAVQGVRLMAELRRATEDLQHSRERLVLAREEERRRIRRDLHDDLAPTLAGLALKARTISDLLPDDPAKAAPLAHGLHAAMREAVGGIRRLVYDLRPPALDELGLLGAIRERAAQFSTQHADEPRLWVIVDAPPALPPLPAAVEVAAFRIVQEALMNVARHAHARTCRVRLALDATLEIEITDDGAGCGSATVPGVGFRSMQERAAELGGTWEITSSVGGGSRVHVSLPIRREGAG